MNPASSRLQPSLVYIALSTAIISSLGLLLIPTIAKQFGVSVGTAQWMLTVNLLVGAVATPIVGRLTDGNRPKRLLIVVLGIILMGSIIAATSTTFGQLLVGRAFQGFSYTVVPITIAIVRRHAVPAKVAGGISALSVTVATGIGIGYPLTGIIASLFDFRFAFWFATLFVAVAIVVAILAVPARSDLKIDKKPFDFPGTILLAVGLACLILGVSEGSSWGWLSAGTLGVLIAAVVLLVAWVLLELRAKAPLINLKVLKNSDVLVANGTALGLGTAMYIGLSLISLVAQAPAAAGYGLNMPLFWAGFVMVPLSFGSQLSNQVARLLAHRVPTRLLLPVGAGFVTLANGFMLFEHDALWEVVIGMLFFGMGIGLTFAAMPTLISRSVVVHELGSAVSFNQVLRTIGGSLGSAVAAAILAAHLAPDLLATAQGVDVGFAVSTAACALVFVSLVVHNLHGARATARAAVAAAA